MGICKKKSDNKKKLHGEFETVSSLSLQNLYLIIIRYLFQKDHICPIEELYQRFNSDNVKGLTSDEAEKKLTTLGKNKLTPPKTKPKWLLFLINLFGGFNLLLWLGSAASIISYIIERYKTEDYKNDNVCCFFCLI